MLSWRTWAAVLLVAVLGAGCGGGGGDSAGTCVIGGCSTVDPTTPVVEPPKAADMTIALSSNTMPNTVDATVEATITTVDSNRASMPNIPVTVSVNAGATVKLSAAVSDASGQVKAVVSLGGDVTPRTITVTAVSGSLTKTAVVQVSGTTTAADLTLVVAPGLLHNTGTASVTATATAVDSNRNVLAGVPVTLSVDNGGIIKPANTVSDANGQVTGAVFMGQDKTNRSITVTAVSGGLTRKAVVQVDGTKIKSTLIGAVLTPGQSGSVQYVVTDFNSIPMVGVTMVITGATGQQTTVTTGATGEYVYTFQAPSAGGSYNIRASVPGVEDIVTVLVSAGTGFIPSATGPVQSASVSASPSVVQINSPSSNLNRATVRALFLGNANAPVKNVRVRFDLNGDKQSIGGTFSSGSAQVYSDANGVATASYISGPRFSPTDGVTVRACWSLDDFPSGSCPNQALTTLTVISDSLSVTIGTNAEILEGDSKLTYVKRYAVQVVDSSGLAAKDVQVSAQVDLLSYYKGEWAFSAAADRWIQSIRATCANEDLNRNGVSETLSNGVIEDANGSANRTAGRPALEPRKADVAVSFEGGVSKTNESGIVVIRIEYPQNVASWVYFNVVVGASGIAGTEGRANFEGILPVAAAAVTKKDLPPPFQFSPYGIQSSGVTPGSLPVAGAKVVMLCTNPD